MAYLSCFQEMKQQIDTLVPVRVINAVKHYIMYKQQVCTIEP